MNRDEAKDRIDRKLLQYPYEGTIHATVAEDIIDEIYDYFESRTCKDCKDKNDCIVLSGLQKETANLPYDYIENFIMNIFSCNKFKRSK